MPTDLKEFEKFLKICRKQGVSDISYDGMSVKFGEMPIKAPNQIEDEEILTDSLSPEQMMFYAVENAGQA